MNKPDPIPSVVAEAAPAEVRPATPVVTAAGGKLDVLEGDEIIQLSIKPSLWFIPLVSGRVLLALALCAGGLGLAVQTGAGPGGAVSFQVLAVIAGVRLTIAMLQWGSRLYVLTNRRVLRFTGVLSVSVTECRLAQIGSVDVMPSWYGQALRLGTLRMRTGGSGGRALDWEEVARPQEIHEILVRAIRKSQSGPT